MIRETLAAIGAAGRTALQCLGPHAEVRTQISQVREWSFAMPHLGRVTVANSPIHQVYVGISQPLAQALGGPDRQVVLLEGFKQALVGRVPARRPIGAWEMLPPDGHARVLRGVRSFILRQQTPVGNLYIMADVASRGEFETLRQNAWEEELAAQYLPRDIAKLTAIEGPAAVAGVGSYLARFEHDIEVLVPGEDGLIHSGNGVLLSTSRDDGRTLLWLSLDLGKEQRAALQTGRELEGSFGAAGRVFRFRTHCAGTAALPLDDVAGLSCALFAMPERFHLDQRRRYFRVAPEQPLNAQFVVAVSAGDDPPADVPADEKLPEAADPGDADAAAADCASEAIRTRRAAGSPPPAGAVEAEITDLSFSGLGLRVVGDLPGDLRPGARIHMWLSGAGLPRRIELSGVVRRLATTPRGRGRFESDVGVEFVIEEPADREGTQQVRQYVMAQQRQLLARRNAEGRPVAS